MTKLLDNNNHIFKYVSFNTNSLKNLINGELWFGKPKNQNDPFEGEFVIEGFSEKFSKEKKLKIIKQMFPNDNINYLKEKYDNDLNDKEFFMDYSDYMKKLIKDYFGICCFSNTYKEILLWTHYSDSHRGMCLIFDKENLNDSLTNNGDKIDGNNTNYSLNVPRIKVELHENGFPFINGYNQLLFKYENFRYENEYRYIKIFDPIFSEERNIKIDNSALAGIIFGESMPNDNKRTIVNLLKSIPSYSNVKIYVSTKNIVTRSIRIELVHEQHPSFYDLFKDQGAKQRFPF